MRTRRLDILIRGERPQARKTWDQKPKPRSWRLSVLLREEFVAGRYNYEDFSDHTVVIYDYVQTQVAYFDEVLDSQGWDGLILWLEAQGR